MILTAKIKANSGEEAAGEVIMTSRQFKTGSTGFWGAGKVMIGGKRYQVQVQAVEIGSKPATLAEG